MIIACINVADSMANGAYGLTNLIGEHTTPEQFNQFVEATRRRFPEFEIGDGGRCGWHAMAVAAKLHNLALIAHLAHKCPLNINLGTETGCTPISLAIHGNAKDHECMATVGLLLSLGANPNLGAVYEVQSTNRRERRPEMSTALWNAIRFGQIKTAIMLLDAGGQIYASTANYCPEFMEFMRAVCTERTKRAVTFLACMTRIVGENPLPRDVLRRIVRYLRRVSIVERYVVGKNET